MIFVTGATGRVGRQVVEQLLQRGQRVRALTCNPAKANLPTGVEVVASKVPMVVQGAAPRTLAHWVAENIAAFR